MKKLVAAIVFLVSAFLYNPVAHAAGGDLGGGGIGRFQLSLEEREILLSQPTVEEAFETWKQLLDKKKQQQLMKDVFDAHIIQQLSQ